MTISGSVDDRTAQAVGTAADAAAEPLRGRHRDRSRWARSSIATRRASAFAIIRFTADSGVFVNGEHIYLKGVNDHHDLGALGAAFNDARRASGSSRCCATWARTPFA